MSDETKVNESAGLDADGAADGNSYAYEGKCNCDKCKCQECVDVKSGECACCAHGCGCCCHDPEAKCDCEDDCGCEPGSCNCGHGPCASEACTCACGCGGHGRTHVCPVCGMELKPGQHCACSAATCGCHEHSGTSSSAVVGIATLVSLATFDVGMKVWAVTRALQRGDKRWVIPLTLINSVGVLPAIYLKTHKKP